MVGDPRVGRALADRYARRDVWGMATNEQETTAPASPEGRAFPARWSLLLAITVGAAVANNYLGAAPLQ